MPRPRSTFAAACRLAAPWLLAATVGAATAGCGGRAATPTVPTLPELRQQGPATTDPEVAGLWLLRELVSTGGDAARAVTARRHLDSLGKGGMLAALARGLDDALHGRLAAAGDAYLRAAEAARESSDPRAPLIAWFAANRGVSLAHDGTDLWKRWRPFVEKAVAAPRGLGWRARGELVEWALDQAFAEGERHLDQRVVDAYGCATSARIAGPFGRGSGADAVRDFPPERPGPWPYTWPAEPGFARAPRVLDVEAHSCAIRSTERTSDGMFYAETYFDLPEERELLVAVQGALAVRVDDRVVLDRDVRKWGAWPEFGVWLRLGPGRHRLVAKLGEPGTSIRFMRPDGTPAGITGSVDAAPGYVTTPPRIVGDPNVLSRWVRDGKVVDPGDDLVRVLGAFIAHLESSDDVASELVTPLVDAVEKATGPTLSLAAMFAGQDPIFEKAQGADLVRELHTRAARKDPGLWASRLAIALGVADRKGPEEAIPELSQLAKEFPGVPDTELALARTYGELGWATEHGAAVKTLLERFPEHEGALLAALDVYESEGAFDKVDELLARMRRLDRDDESSITRALAREDYAAAVAELTRLADLHPERKDLPERILDAKVRAGNEGDVLKKLEAAVAKDPKASRARLDLADARFALGQGGALRQALADSVEAGANPALLGNAIDLVEGMTELEPYRLDARSIIAAHEKSGTEMPGTAARILDYAALWVHSDGSSRMLEHEIIRLQSAEAISAFAEHRTLEGLVLHMRVIKRDGTTLEPLQVPGKPTVTFPHLEVGDYIETEQVLFTPGDPRGTQYAGPRWFFREENVGYARSEFLVVSPESRELVVETTGDVPDPVVTRKDGFVARRWRVDYSPAAPSEPNSTPVTEFLPSVRIGWGVTLEQRLQTLGDALTQTIPVDPRIQRIAEHVVADVPAADGLARARKLYRWLLDNVEPGDESDARRIIIGRKGNLWHGFRVLCRAVGLPLRYAVAQSRLAAPPLGPLSRATLFTQPVAKVAAPNGDAWLTLGNKYAPFGYLPADVRGMPAFFLDGAKEQTTVPDQGSADGIAFTGKGKLDAQGTLTLELAEEFSGRLAVAVRKGLSQVAPDELHTVIESNVLAQALRGATLEKHVIEHQDDLDSPLVLRMTVRVPRFAQRTGASLVVMPPLSPDLGRMATLASRKTPLLIGETLHRRVAIDVELPPRATADVPPANTQSDADRHVTVADAFKAGVLRFERTIDIPAGRVQPAEYGAFADFARKADDALSRAVQVRLE